MKKRIGIIILFLTILLIAGCNNTVEKSEIEIAKEEIFADVDLHNVRSDLVLPSLVHNVKITWISSDEEIISTEGRVVQNDIDKLVKLTAVFTFNAESEEVTYQVVVRKKVPFSIEDIKNMNVNDNVTTTGVVVGKIGFNYYIYENGSGIYVEDLIYQLNIGDRVRLDANIAIKDNIKYLKSASNIKIINSNNAIDSTKIELLADANKINGVYSINDLEIVSLSSPFNALEDSYLIVEDENENSFKVNISKRIDYNLRQDIYTELDNVEAGYRLNLENVILTSNNEFLIQSTDSFEVIIDKTRIAYYPSNLDLLHKYLDEYEFNVGLPNVGEASVLIIPVEFSDYKFSNSDVSRINTSFFGTSAETGWESVKTYYQKSSYGNLNISGVVLNKYTLNMRARDLENKYGENADYYVISQVLKYYDSTIDYSNYDKNKDGYIDGIVLIYSAPVDYQNDSIYWAYVYQYYPEKEEVYDNVKACYYMWAGYDFIDEAFIDNGYTDKVINNNAVTFIHEMGHMLGLDDYYDYDEKVGPAGGLGGADMMDYNVGDHNPFSKIMLGWTTPYVVSNKSVTVTLNEFSKTGDVILVTDNWNESYFDEYFLIDFYTPTLLNQAHKGYNSLFDISGVRIYHIDARIDENYGSPMNMDGYYTVFSYNNSDTDKKLIKYVEADNNNSIEKTNEASNDDLFQVGDVFGPNYKYHDNNYLGFQVKIVSITSTSATIEIKFN